MAVHIQSPFCHHYHHCHGENILQIPRCTGMFCDPRHVNKSDEVLSVGTSDGEHVADLKQPLQSRTGVTVWQMYFKVILV